MTKFDLTRKYDIEDLYEARKKAGTQKERDYIDLQMYRILNQHPKITMYREQLVNAVRRGYADDVAKISMHIRYLEKEIYGHNI